MAVITQKRNSDNPEGIDDVASVKDVFTGEYPKVDNQFPEKFMSSIIPVALSPIKVIKLTGDDRGSSNALIALAKRIGFEVEHYELGLYGSNKRGRTRSLSGSELVQGYPMYGKSSEALAHRLTLLNTGMKQSAEFIKLIKAKTEAYSDPVKFDEWDDCDRLTIQRTQYYGRFLSVPASADLIDLSYPKRFLEIIELVCKHYIDLTEASMPPRNQVMSLITDAQETAIGAPSFSSSGVDSEGRSYHEKRIITLADMPVPDYREDPGIFLDDAYLWGEQLGLPDGSMAFASAISYRQGAKGHKAQKLWYFNGTEFVADYEAMSWESNQRLVYPAPHCLNVVLTPAVYQMKMARKKKLGLYHSPEMVNAYISALNKQGPISYESDFSGFDTTISNQILQFVFRTLAKYAKKYHWEYSLFSDFIESTGVIFPSFLSDENLSVTYFSRAVSLLSGILPTSESGSIVSLAANLFALEDQIPSVVNDWLSNRFVILVQSDDVLFTLPKTIDEDRFFEQMTRLRLTAKLKQGNMFLKKLLPVGTLRKFLGEFPLAGVPLLSRQVQQTMFNENSYEGKPDAIIRLALLSRAEGLNKHPAFDKSIDEAWRTILSSYPIFKPIIDVMYQGVLALPEEDKKAVIDYSSSEDGMAWVSKIYNRAESDPKARQTLEQLAKLGFSLDQYEDTAVSQRLSYLQALYSPPTTSSRDMLDKILAWTGMSS